MKKRRLDCRGTAWGNKSLQAPRGTGPVWLPLGTATVSQRRSTSTAKLELSVLQGGEIIYTIY